jgi:site-specific DNA recombinase
VGLTIGYVRVSTEDQVEYSPDAQANRCRQFAKEHDLGAVTILRDDGWSGKNLERPAMRELVALVEVTLRTLASVAASVLILWG